MPPPRKIKCLLLGSPSVGKQDLINAFRHVHVDLARDSVRWTHFAYMTKVPVYCDLLIEVDINGTKESVALELANGDHYGARKNPDKRVEVNILCFDVTALESLDQIVERWLPEIRIREKAHKGTIRDQVRILLVGTNIELREDDTVLAKQPRTRSFREKSMRSIWVSPATLNALWQRWKVLATFLKKLFSWHLHL
ncbi:hypothetical protein DL96DRAFT_1014576 [Flagelloscypha sp. PMI_526]|nr:hypothetical protein DL96DRAFT_1014576 [Flagelloscypha sp. PMI_526]